MKEQYNKAAGILNEYKADMHELAKYLYEHETITGEEFMDILNRKAEEVPEEDASASLTNRS